MPNTTITSLATGQLVRHNNTDDIGVFVKLTVHSYPVVDFGAGHDETIAPWYIEPVDIHYVSPNGEITTK